MAPGAGTAAVQPLVAAWRLDHTFDYSIPDDLQDRIRVGSLVRVPLGSRKVRGVVRSVAAADNAGDLESILSVVLDVPVAEPPFDRILDLVAERYAVPRAQVFERAVPPRVRVRPLALEERGGPPPAPPQGYEGLEGLLSQISGDGGGVWVWQVNPAHDRVALIAALLAAVERGSSLVVLPEVRHSSDAFARLGSLGATARIDSAIEPVERARGMLALAGADPERRIIGLGGRASVLSPAAHLRLIVVDEEHHPSLKEDRSPRYDARWVAARRAEESGAVCVFLSPTPTLEATARVSRGSWSGVGTDRERQRAARPLVLVSETPRSGLSPELHSAVKQELDRGGRVGLLVPGAGFARVLWCANCRRSLVCPRCEAGMSYAADTRHVACPRCRFEAPAPDRCAHCGATAFRYLGAGSQRIAAQVTRIFPRASVVRVDPSVLEATSRPVVTDADIYVTTWIGTKPEIRPDVRLVGVLDADWMIHRPDFRSTERAYHALSAMAAWAGPADQGGRLLIQTYEPGHHCIQAVVRADHAFFSEREMAVREELGYPPFFDLVKVRVSGTSATELVAQVRASVTPQDRILGPIEVRATEDEPAVEMLIKTPDVQRVSAKLRGILPRVPKGTRLRVDVDPR